MQSRLWLPNTAQLFFSVLPLIISWQERLFRSGIELCSGYMAYDSGKVKEKGNLGVKKINKKKEKKKVSDQGILSNISRWLKAASDYMQGRIICDI